MLLWFRLLSVLQGWRSEDVILDSFMPPVNFHWFLLVPSWILTVDITIVQSGFSLVWEINYCRGFYALSSLPRVGVSPYTRTLILTNAYWVSVYKGAARLSLKTKGQLCACKHLADTEPTVETPSLPDAAFSCKARRAPSLLGQAGRSGYAAHA